MKVVIVLALLAVVASASVIPEQEEEVALERRFVKNTLEHIKTKLTSFFKKGSEKLKHFATKVYAVAKKAFEKIIKNGTFDKVLNKLVSLIDSKPVEAECSKLATDAIDKISKHKNPPASIVNSVCNTALHLSQLAAEYGLKKLES